eukprot:TRINITY_DN6373_c0_g1_i1.p1 TRINITY_DN6373_c0_g1~~TRINITY_DN6373_c0_g1_i1.p1  ORF type:complete len:142 (+),score=23.98 TRINITY_DN6373_c0_g1_i1:900-1325(+)
MAFKLSLVQRKEIKSYEDKIAELVKRLDAATGTSGWKIEADYNVLGEAMGPTSNDKNFSDRLGQVVYSYAENVTKKVEELCKDDMSKEAFNDAVTSKTVVIQKDPKQSTFVMTKIVDNKLVIGFQSYCNVGQAGEGIEKLL